MAIPEISRILMGYKKALDKSRARYENMYRERAKNTRLFYDKFLKNLIINFSKDLREESKQNEYLRLTKNFFRRDEIKFVAVDGTCYKHQLTDYMVFFGAAYAIRGSLNLISYPPKIKYERFSAEEDVSMVAYVPIPFAELNEILEENLEFVSSDNNKIDLSSIHVLLMQLAEIYLLYSLVKRSAIESPKLLLWDHSISSVLVSTDVGILDEAGQPKIKLIGYSELGRPLMVQDVIIAFSHPWNDELNVPAPKEFRMYNFIIKKTYEKSPISLDDISKSAGIPKNRILEKLQESRKLKGYIIQKRDELVGKTEVERPILIYDAERESISFNPVFRGSWNFTITVFEHICRKLFKEKDPEALIFRKITESGERECWLTPNDLRFLIAVGVRALIEECWKQQILLVGIVKDSSSKYFTRNFIGVMSHIGIYHIEDKLKNISLPWTDRTLLELLPYIDDELLAPWSTIEFDSIFMTLHLEKDPDGNIEIHGVRGEATNPERVALRSLAQFYINKSKVSPLTGHVIFLDRISFPFEDKNFWGDVTIETERLGKIKPIFYKKENTVQKIMIFLLEELTKNLFPEVIGYPDPLHKADWGAKSILRKVKPIIESGEISFRSRPLRKTLRELREQVRR